MSKSITEKKGKKLLLLIILFSCFSLFATAQKDSIPVLKTYRIGIFAALYLDTIFTSTGAIRFTDAIPKFITPGLEFVHGAQEIGRAHV